MTYLKDTTTIYVYHPQTDAEYEISADWYYQHDSGSYYDPPYEEFKVKSAQVISIDGIEVQEEIPDWLSWSELESMVYEKTL